MEVQAELVSRFFRAIGKRCEWKPWPEALRQTPIGDLVHQPDGAWLVRVADDTGVDVSALDPDERAFLQWALPLPLAREEKEPIAWLRQCPVRDLVQAVAGLESPEPLQQLARSILVGAYPAHLVAMEWSTRVSGTSELRESAEMVKKVVEAYFEVNAWWCSPRWPFVIAAVSRMALRNAWASLGHADVDVRALSVLAEQVASAMRTEAMIDARVAVSGVIRHADEGAAGIAMLELARREAVQQNKDAVVFGDDPVRMALHWLEEPTRAAFLRAISSISELDPSDWPQGWGELAEAMVRSNLNVSEAARSLYMHRNTLLTRIEKLRENVGV